MKRIPRRIFLGYVLAEGTGFIHYCYAKRRAREAPLPDRAPADAEYGRRFLSMARCDAREGGLDSLACARFVRHAFFGTPPEALSKEDLSSWLQTHMGDSSIDDAVSALIEALGPYAPTRSSGVAKGNSQPPYFVYGEGTLQAWYKPLLLRLFLEAQRKVACRRLRAAGFVEVKDAKLPQIRYWERLGAEDVTEPPLVVLHGYGRGLASSLFEDMIPKIGRRSVIIVDCHWLMVTRVPATGDVSGTPTVRQIAEAVSGFLSSRLFTQSTDKAPAQVDILGHSFGTAVASALVRELEGDDYEDFSPQRRVRIRRTVLMDPMCFIPGISKQAQLLRRTPRDLAEELVAETAPGSSGLSPGEVMGAVLNKPKPFLEVQLDEEAAAKERRKWVIYQAYFFNYFIFRDLVYCWMNLRALQGPEYLDRGLLRQANRDGRLLTVLAETDTMIPATLLREELSADAPKGSDAGVMWLPVVGHGACQHRSDVIERISRFLEAA